MENQPNPQANDQDNNPMVPPMEPPKVNEAPKDPDSKGPEESGWTIDGGL